MNNRTLAGLILMVVAMLLMLGFSIYQTQIIHGELAEMQTWQRKTEGTRFRGVDVLPILQEISGLRGQITELKEVNEGLQPIFKKRLDDYEKRLEKIELLLLSKVNAP